MVRVQIEEEDLLDALMDRVKFWTDDEEVLELYEQMYNSMIEDGCFTDAEINIPIIVDNDYVNWCGLVQEGDELYDECRELIEAGETGGSYYNIEAYNKDKTLILIRQ